MAHKEDHPRVCGEHGTTVWSDPDNVGSSPRMRGALGHMAVYLPWLGIIPAYAGSTYPVQVTDIFGWDHPRVCGEHSVTL